MIAVAIDPTVERMRAEIDRLKAAHTLAVKEYEGLYKQICATVGRQEQAKADFEKVKAKAKDLAAKAKQISGVADAATCEAHNAKANAVLEEHHALVEAARIEEASYAKLKPAHDEAVHRMFALRDELNKAVETHNARVDHLNARAEEQKGGTGRMSGIVKSVFKPEKGTTDTYFDGLGKPDGPGHGHIQVDEQGDDTIIRDHYAPRQPGARRAATERENRPS